MNRIKQQYKLTNEDISKCLKQIDDLSNIEFEDEKYLTKIKLVYEEALLNLKSFYGEDKKIFLCIEDKKDLINIDISYDGENYNPLKYNKVYDNYEIMSTLIENFGANFNYKLSNQKNIIYTTIKKKKKISFGSQILFAIIFGIVFGILLNKIPSNISENIFFIINSLISLILNLIKMISLPIIFLSLITGILNCGNITTFRAIGKKTLISYIITMVMIGIFCFIAFYIVYPLKINFESNNSNNLKLFIDTIISMFPTNIISPFYEENCIQIVFLGVVVGFGILISKNKVSLISDIFIQLNLLVNNIFDIFSVLIPYLVFLIIIKNVYDGKSLVLYLKAWKAILVYIIVNIIVSIVLIFLVKQKTKFSYKNILKYIFPSYLKGLVTSCSYCVWSEMLDCLQNKFKLDKSQSEFNLAFAFTFLRSGFTATMMLIFYHAYNTNMSISISWIITLIIFLILFNVSTPSLPGNSVIVIALIFDIFLVDYVDYVGFATSFLVVIDFILTGFRIILFICEIILINDKNYIENK